ADAQGATPPAGGRPAGAPEAPSTSIGESTPAPTAPQAANAASAASGVSREASIPGAPPAGSPGGVGSELSAGGGNGSLSWAGHDPRRWAGGAVAAAPPAPAPAGSATASPGGLASVVALTHAVVSIRAVTLSA